MLFGAGDVSKYPLGFEPPECLPVHLVHAAKIARHNAPGTNIGSVRYALQRLGTDAALTSDPATIRAADKVILPGVGAAGPGMTRLRQLGLVELLCADSEEGDTACLGVIPAPVRRFVDTPGLRVPHMGWNRVAAQREHPLLAGLGDDDQAYFVHSYAVPTGAWTLASSDHGTPFSAVIAHRNYYGMQFHPERSAGVGARLLQHFLDL